MGKGGKWLSAFKCCLTPDCDAGKSQENHKFKAKSESGKTDKLNPSVAAKDEVRDQDGAQLHSTPSMEIKPPTVLVAEPPTTGEDESNKHDNSVDLFSTVAGPTASARLPSKSKEEVAAIVIQAAFREYMPRKVLRPLRGQVRLKKLVEGNAVKKQTAAMLQTVQTVTKLQLQIQARRNRMTQENEALQRQLLLKHEREQKKLKNGKEWDGSLQTKEQIEARIVNKHEAAIRRERALAYSFCHQWKASSRAVTPMFSYTDNPQSGWSWLGHWKSARPWENRITHDTMEIVSKDRNLERTPILSAQKSARPPNRHSLSSASSKPSFSAGRKTLASPRSAIGLAEDLRSMSSLSSDHRRRHSIAGSSVRDNDSLTSSCVPSQLTSTEFAGPKSRSHLLHINEDESFDSVSFGSVKKRLSFSVMDKQNSSSSATARRRHSGPPKINSGSMKL